MLILSKSRKELRSFKGVLALLGLALLVLSQVSQISGFTLRDLYRMWFQAAQSSEPTTLPNTPPPASNHSRRHKRKVMHSASSNPISIDQQCIEPFAIANSIPVSSFNGQIPDASSPTGVQPFVNSTPDPTGGGCQATLLMSLGKQDQAPACKVILAGKPAYQEVEKSTGLSPQPKEAIRIKSYPAVPPSCVSSQKPIPGSQFSRVPIPLRTLRKDEAP